MDKVAWTVKEPKVVFLFKTSLPGVVWGGGGTSLHVFTGRARCHYHTAASFTIQLAISLGILRLLDSTAHVLPAPTVSFANGKCLTHLPPCGQQVSPGTPMHPDTHKSEFQQERPALSWACTLIVT